MYQHTCTNHGFPTQVLNNQAKTNKQANTTMIFKGVCHLAVKYMNNIKPELVENASIAKYLNKILQLFAKGVVIR